MDAALFKILEWLAPKGIGVLDNIGQPLSEIFVVTDTHNISTIHEAKKLNFFLDNLIAENIIGMPDRPDRALGEPHTTDGYRWLKEWPIGAYITLRGFNLLREEYLKKEKKDLESSIKKTNDATIGNIIMTAIFTIVVIILQIIGNQREVKRDIRQKEQAHIEQVKNTQTEELAKSLKSSLDSIRQAILLISFSRNLSNSPYLTPLNSKDSAGAKK